MKKLLIMIAAITLFACNKPNDDLLVSSYIGSSFEFSVFNSQNEDLLDPATPNHYDASEIKLFYLIDGEIKEVYNPTADFPRNYRIEKRENEYRIVLFLNHPDASDTTFTYIQWNNNDKDTIETVYQRFGSSALKGKVWLNGLEIYDLAKNAFEIEYYKLIK